MSKTAIEWASKVWNPITGCTNACSYCYARKFAHRMRSNPNQKISRKYRNGFNPTFHPEELNEPATWRKPQTVFVGSMGDLFDPEFPYGVFAKIMQVMSTYRQHTFMLLTRRPHIMQAYSEQWIKEQAIKTLPDNIWCGITITNQQQADDLIPTLINVPAKIKFISIEPITGPIDLSTTKQLHRNFLSDLLFPKFFNYISNIDWVICGGMSGTGATPAHPHWIMTIRDTCARYNKPFFFKQWGAYHTSWMNQNTGLQVFKMYDNYLRWQQRLWVKPGDKLVSIDGTIPTTGSQMKTCAYPVAIMSPVKKGKHIRTLDEITWNQKPNNL